MLLFQVNLGMYLTFGTYVDPWPVVSFGDRLADAIIGFCSGHAVEIFSFLFGLSYILFLRGKDGTTGYALLRRRFVGMLLLGLFHGILIFEWDIVFTYGVIGLILIWVEPRLSDRGLLVAAVVLTILMSFGINRIIFGDADAADAAYMLEPRADPYEDLVKGPLSAYFMARLDLWIMTVPSQLFSQSWSCAVMILLGIWCGRRGVVQDRGFRDRLCRDVLRILSVPALIWLAASTLLPAITSPEQSHAVLYDNPIMFAIWPVLTMVATLWLIAFCAAYVATARLGPVRGWLEACGRMSLTGYMTHSLALMVVFTYLGFGAVGVIPRGWGHIAGIIYVLLQGIAAQWWLQRFATGPDEWLLRSWMYRSWQPMLRAKLFND